ncbi:MAG: hypothetical protein HC857_01140 [Synechococcales cyanobacterium RU_4_20]|nr:hypothetical protein [Synechococcales cyanobacterium RU_4_20]NJR71135.1 hypothetical protein [Synechococcales cyanobacterium CRU_2_2]
MGKPSDTTKRTTITLPANVYEGLEQWAESEGRATASLAAFLVEACVRSKFPKDFSPQLSVNLTPATVEGDRDE